MATQNGLWCQRRNRGSRPSEEAEGDKDIFMVRLNFEKPGPWRQGKPYPSHASSGRDYFGNCKELAPVPPGNQSSRAPLCSWRQNLRRENAEAWLPEQLAAVTSPAPRACSRSGRTLQRLHAREGSEADQLHGSFTSWPFGVIEGAYPVLRVGFWSSAAQLRGESWKAWQFAALVHSFVRSARVPAVECLSPAATVILRSTALGLELSILLSEWKARLGLLARNSMASVST